MGLRQSANGSWRKILSQELSLSLGIAAARPSKYYAMTELDSISSPDGSRKVAFAGGLKTRTRLYTHYRRNSSRSFFITACPIRPVSRLRGGSCLAPKLKPRAIPLRLSCNSKAGTDPDFFARPSCCE